MVSAPTTAEAVLGEALVIEVVTGGSSLALSFVWKKDGVRLSNSGRIQGASTSSLTISNVTLNDIGLYECIPSNQDGSFNSSMTQVNIRSKLAIDSEMHDCTACNLHFVSPQSKYHLTSPHQQQFNSCQP